MFKTPYKILSKYVSKIHIYKNHFEFFISVRKKKEWYVKQILTAEFSKRITNAMKQY